MRSVALLLPGQLGGFLSHDDGRSVGVARGEGREDPGEGTLRFRLCREPLRTALRWIARQQALYVQSLDELGRRLSDAACSGRGWEGATRRVRPEDG